MPRLKAPYLRVIVVPKEGEQFELSDRVTNFVYDESIEKDNMVEFSVSSRYDELIVEDERLEAGAEILFMFGYVGGARSQTHRAVITDIRDQFVNLNINLKIRALDKGAVLKKTSSSQIYENSTSTDIARIIAERHGLKINADNTTRVWEKQPQGNIDDLNFLRKLAQQEESGNYIVFIKDDTLNFVRRGLDTTSLITYTNGQGNNGILKFDASRRESTAEPEGLGSTGIGFDPLNKEFNISSESAESENNTIATDDFHLIYSADGDHLANGTNNESIDIEGFVETQTKDGTGDSAFQKSGLSDIIRTGKQFVSGAFGKDLTNKVASGKKAKTQKILTATLTVVGNPLLKVNALLTMKNVTKKYDGNWFIISCKHSINGSHYITENTLNRNASKKAIKGKNTKVAAQANKTQGDTVEVDERVVILEFDADGNRTADITEAGNYVPPQDI